MIDQIEEFFSYEESGNVLAIDETLNRLAKFDERGAEVVQYRFFGGRLTRRLPTCSARRR